MAGVDFFSSGAAAPDPTADPSGFARAQTMAKMLMQQGTRTPQGQTVGGQYVAPSPMSYVGQAANAFAGMNQMDRLAEAQRASNLLNGGTGAASGFNRMTGLLGGR